MRVSLGFLRLRFGLGSGSGGGAVHQLISFGTYSQNRGAEMCRRPPGR
jgi:hypothetical protein